VPETSIYTLVKALPCQMDLVPTVCQLLSLNVVYDVLRWWSEPDPNPSCFSGGLLQVFSGVGSDDLPN